MFPRCPRQAKKSIASFFTKKPAAGAAAAAPAAGAVVSYEIGPGGARTMTPPEANSWQCVL